MKRKLLQVVLVVMLIFLLAPVYSFSQKHHKSDGENEIEVNKSWSFSINTGVAYADRYHANFYNGADSNENKINFVLDNKYYRYEIRNAIGDSFALVGMPTNMKYDPAFCVGFSIKKKFNDHVGMFAQFNFARFKAKDFFTMKIGAVPPGTTATENLRNYPIWGKEDRINIDLGVSGEIKLADKIYGFLEGGLNINNTRVKENKISIENLEYSIIDVFNVKGFIPGQTQENTIKQGGLGIGAFLSPGIQFRFNENVAIDLLGSIYYSKINLKKYDTFGLHYNVMLRFVFSTSVTLEN